MFVIKEMDSGSWVEIIQLALKRGGYYRATIDGIFGGQTKAAVMNFQKDNRLVADGIVGKNTFSALRKFLVGYIEYTVEAGDTLFKIVRKVGGNLEQTIIANPNIEPENLKVGQKIIVILNFPLVYTSISYNSLFTELICEGLVVRYPFISLRIVGYSVLGRPLVLLKIGQGRKKIFLNASHHANEWITTPMLLKYLEDYSFTVAGLGEKSSNAVSNFAENTAYFLPLVNPDGVDLVTGALEKDTETYYNILNLANNYPFVPFPSGWKANARGVDLNLNYPALWEQGKEIKFEAGFTVPGPINYVGNGPLDQPETRAVYDISIRERFDITLSLHTQGQEIYWRFGPYEPPGAKEIGEKMAEVSGYTLTDPEEFQSFGGYKDWFVMTYLKPGYTIEAGLGINPLPIRSFDSFYPPVESIINVAFSAEI